MLLILNKLAYKSLNTVERAAGRVLVMTSDGRCYVGLLKACDQATNLVLDEAVERIYSIDVCFAPLAL